jgi:hypothetical protein
MAKSTIFFFSSLVSVGASAVVPSNNIPSIPHAI